MQYTAEELTSAAKSVETNTLKVVVFNNIRAISRENWFEWSSQEAQQWLENLTASRECFTPVQCQAIALITMKQFLALRAA